MGKLTLRINDKEKIAWIKNCARASDTNMSQLLEEYIEALRNFDRFDVPTNIRFKLCNEPGNRQ